MFLPILALENIKTIKTNKGNFTYPLNFRDFCKHSSMFKNSHLGVSNFGFLSLRYIKVWFSLTLPFRTEKY